MKAIVVYITTKDKGEAQLLAEKLFEQRLIACANISENMTSIYRWQNKIENSTECTLLLKTLDDCFARIESVVKEFHSYDCPCIISWNIERIAPEFLHWMESETNHEVSKS